MDPLLPALLRHAANPAPRYTSFPPANRFSADFPASQAADWLAGLPPAQPVSLYVHIPFCRQQCWYCACNQTLTARYEPVASYAATLRREIAMMAAIAPSGLAASRIHFGGGTPSVLREGEFRAVMDALRSLARPVETAEIAIEIDPRTFDLALAPVLAREGVNRVNLGVQSFDPSVQAAINRVQPEHMVAAVVEALRCAGIPHIGFDLMYGLPRQTTASITASIATILAMRPDRVALFGYAHVPWFAKAQRMIDEAELPAAGDRAAQLLCARRALLDGGLQAIGIDHFARTGDSLAKAAREGRMRRNFQGYVDDDAPALIGLGASSISSVPDGHWQNITQPKAWAKAVEAGRLPVARGCRLSDNDRIAAAAIEQIMCGQMVDLAALAHAHGQPESAFDRQIASLSDLQAEGLVQTPQRVLRLTEAGQLLARVVASRFDPGLAPAVQAHALAV